MIAPLNAPLPALALRDAARPAPVDPLVALHDGLAAAERCDSLGARLAELLGAAHRLGLGCAAVIAHEARAVEVLAHVHVPGRERALPARLPGPAVWRRWHRIVARHPAVHGPGPVRTPPMSDPWVRTENGAPLCVARGTLPPALLLVPLADARGQLLATLVAEVLEEGPVTEGVLRAVELLTRYAARYIEHDRLATLAERRAARLQRLHEAGAALSRSLDETEIVRELARQVGRLLDADGIVVAHPDVERGTVRTAARVVRGLARPRADQPLGGGVLAAVARTGDGMRIDDYDPARLPLAAADDVVGDGGPAGSVLALPMRVGTQLLGVVAVHATHIRAYTAEDEELLRTVVGLAGTALANARLYAESEAERRQSEALAEVARAVTASLRLGEVLRLILRHTVGLLRAEGAFVALRRDGFLHVVSGVGTVELLGGVHLPVDASMTGRAMRERRAVISNAVREDPSFYRPPQDPAEPRKMVIVPLYAGDAPIGVIAAIDREEDFADADARVLQRLADHVGVAVANARLFEEVSAATREWKAAFDAIAGGMVVLDDQGRVTRCNARAAELLGAPGPKALLGVPFIPALAGAAERTPRCADCRGSCAETCPVGPADDVVSGAIERGETARATTGGQGSVFDVVAAPHPDGGAVVTFDDVTEQRRLAAQLVQREKLAAVGRLVAGVAHELNNPLAGVLTLAELLATETDDDETRELARGVHAEARRAARVAGRLLAFAAQRAPERSRTDVNRVLLDALDLRRYALRAQNIEIDVALDYELPETWADAHQLQQVFLNLITNAEHALASAPLGRRIELWTGREGERLVAAVRDNGPGMGADALARVLDPLHAATAEAGSAGLGLSISDGIVREHGGRLRARTAPGAGATFQVELPIVEPPAAAGLVGADPAR